MRLTRLALVLVVAATGVVACSPATRPSAVGTMSVTCDSRDPATVEVDGATYTVACPGVGTFPLVVSTVDGARMVSTRIPPRP